MGFSKQEIVAIMGRHTIGFADEDTKVVKSRWTQNPYVFDNTYYQELLLGERSKYYKSQADMMLL